MDLLHFLQDIRCPFLDKLCLVLTQLGSEYAFMIVTVIILWCVNKKSGFRMFSLFFTGLVINESIKSAIKVPRPFDKDPTLTVVKDWGKLTVNTSGYSCPSGHTATSVLTFGGMALFLKRKKWIIISAVLILITMFTRLYLGAHTPSDVLISLGISAVIVILFSLLFRVLDKDEKREKFLFIGLIVLSVVAVVIMYLKNRNNLAEPSHSYGETFKLLGCSIGVFIARAADKRFVNYSVQAKPWQQAVKVLIGLAILMGVKTGLQNMFLLFTDRVEMNFFTYLILTVVIGVVYPLTFKLYNKSKRGCKKSPKKEDCKHT